MEIKDIESKDIEKYKEFLQQGLTQDEANFRITPEDEKEAPFPTMDKLDSFTFGAFEDDQLVGIISFEREESEKVKA